MILWYGGLFHPILNIYFYQGLQAIRCPPGLAFDVEKQSCNWRQFVDNCDRKTQTRKALPRISNSEELCDSGELACGEQSTVVCVRRDLFCDGTPDCSDGSDESSCGRFLVLDKLQLAAFSPQTLKTTQIELLLATSRSAGSRIAFAPNPAPRFPGIFVLEARTALKCHRWSP